MTKFGKLINVKTPVLIGFYTSLKEEELDVILDEVLVDLKDEVKVYKIKAEENQKLVDSLQVKNYPTYIIYKNEEMVWRKNEEQTSTELKEAIQEFL